MSLRVPAPTVTAPDWSTDPLGAAIDYLKVNGHLYASFRREVDRRLKQYPSARISADAVMHHIRWTTPDSATGDLFKVNNSAVSLFARLYIKERPRAAQNFEVRRSWVDDLSAADQSRLAFAASHIREPVDRGPLFGGAA